MTKLYLGTDDQNNPITSTPLHILITGIAGSGKTITLNHILKENYKLNPDLELYLADGLREGLDFSPEVKALTYYPIAGSTQETNVEEFNTLLDKLTKILEDRKLQYKKTRSYQGNNLVLLAIEDFRAFGIDISEEAMEDKTSPIGKLYTLLSSGIAFNIITIISSQRFTQDTIPTFLRRHLAVGLIHRLVGMESELIEGSDQLNSGEYLLFHPDRQVIKLKTKTN